MIRRGICVLLLAVLAAPTARAEDALQAAGRHFLQDRDALRLRLALEQAGVPDSSTEAALVRLALGERAGGAAGAGDAQGWAALPRVLVALHDLDLSAAAKALRRADKADGGIAAAWAGALVRMRRGDDAGAVGRLLAPPLFDWGRDAFPLALFGAALPGEDRIMLAAIAQAALVRAASRGRAAAIRGTVLALAAFDAEAGAQAFVRGIRALRRADDLDGAERLFAVAPSVGVPTTHPPLALEGALTAWQRGDGAALAGRLGGVAAPAGAQSAFLALRRAGRRPRVLDTGGGLRHAAAESVYADLVARLSSALGARADRAEVLAFAGREKRTPSHAAVAPAFLRARGLHVVALAGDPDEAERVLAAGHPFLLLRHVRVEAAYAEVPVLVRGIDRRTGLWIVDEPHLDRLDVLPRQVATKARMLCALPPGASALAAALAATPAGRAGQVVQAAMAQADDGDLGDARARLRAGRAGPGVVGDYYLAGLTYRLAVEEHSDERLADVRAALERSRRVPPLLAFEEYARAQGLIVGGDREGGLAALEQVERLEGPSATVAMARYAVLIAAGDVPGALAALDRARAQAPLDARILFYRGLAYSGAGQRARARADLRRALDRRPDGVRVAVTLAALEREDGKPDVALRVLREATRHAPALEDNAVMRAARREAELAQIAGAEHVADLVGLRRSPEPETRRRLAFALAERQAEADEAEALLRTLLADDVPSVRISTLRLYMRPWLRQRVESDAVLGRRVCAVLEQDAEPTVRAAAARLLGRVGAAFSTRSLAAALAGEQADAAADVRSAVARALGLHDADAVPAALVAALEDRDASVRAAAIDVLFERTATRRDFDPHGDEAARAASVALWRAWLDAGD